MKNDSLNSLEKGRANVQQSPTTAAASSTSHLWSVISCLFYCFTSVSMVLTNKAVSASLDPSLRGHIPQFAVLLYQNLIAVVLVEAARLLGFVDYSSFSFTMARQWLPVVILFVAMLSTGFIALIYLSVPMVTILKNLTNVFTVFGDWYLFGENITALTLLSLLIMTIGAVMAGMNDLEFSLVGYFWIALNCLCTAGYILYMRYASVNVKLPKFGMVFYNNLLSILFLAPACIMSSEIISLADSRIMTPYFIMMNTFSGLIGFYLNFASLWCLSSNSATTYAIVGSFNKVPITILGYFLFGANISYLGGVFIALSTLGSFIYAYSKLPTGGASLTSK